MKLLDCQWHKQAGHWEIEQLKDYLNDKQVLYYYEKLEFSSCTYMKEGIKSTSKVKFHSLKWKVNIWKVKWDSWK